MLRSKSGITSGLLVCACALPLTLAIPAAGAASETPGPADSDYVSPESCQTCHPANYDSWSASPHFKTSFDIPGGPSQQGCQACHGAAASHVADPINTSSLFPFEKASPTEVNAWCLTCHTASAEYANALNSPHARSGLSCISCHSPHQYQTRESMLVKSQPELCYTCHPSQKHLFDMASHHRVNEGILQCTDCHDPHGSDQPKHVRASAGHDAVCFKCHGDKQGPFVYEHEPVKVETCTSCHVPHGGPNMHMLKVDTVNTLCLSCHTASLVSHAPGIPNFDNEAAFRYQACTTCHNRIHGSNSNSFFFK